MEDSIKELSRATTSVAGYLPYLEQVGFKAVSKVCTDTVKCRKCDKVD